MAPVRRRVVLSPWVVLIRSEPGMAERLLTEHADDGHGRCRVCSSGAQTGRYRWPCATYLFAAEAAGLSRAATSE